MTLSVLVADDEPIARRHLVRLIEAHPELEVVAQASDGLEAVALIESVVPQVVFLDIQMPGLDGFGVLRQLKLQPLVIFTTAHDQHALAAFKENTVDYLLKPIAPEDMQRAVKKLLARSEPPAPTSQVIDRLLQRLRAPADAPAQILLSVHDLLQPVRFDQIVVLEARDKCTLVHTLECACEAQIALSDLLAKLPAAEFIRIHRRHVVNYRFIKSLRRWGNHQLIVELTVPFAQELLVSRRCYDDVLKSLRHIA